MNQNWYKKAQDYHTFYHGTDSEPWEEYDPQQAAKGEKYYNPLGEAMYVTDKPEFANMFGKNVYEVQIPKDAKIKRMYPSKVESAIESIIKTAMKKVGINYWDTPIGFKIDLGKQIERSRYSPYEAIIEAVALVEMTYPDQAEEFGNWVPVIANQKFSKFDAVIFMGTNNPNDIFIGETPTKEILIFNKEFQKVFQRK